MIQNKQISIGKYYQLYLSSNNKHKVSFSEFKQLAAVAIFGKRKAYTQLFSIISTTNLLLSQQIRLDRLLAKYNKGIPIAYLTGFTEFYGYIFKTRKNVLIPRIETEELVTLAKKYILANSVKINSVLEIGSGTGCIAISLAKELQISLPNLSFTCIEKYKQPYFTSIENSYMLNTNNIISNLNTSLLKYINSSTHKEISIIISNPPYLTRRQMKELPLHTQTEPRSALYGGQDGMQIFKQILLLVNLQKKQFNKLPALFLEADPAIMSQLSKLLSSKYGQENITIYKDLFGLERFITAL